MNILDKILQYWPIASFVVNGVLIWVTWSLRREFVTRTQFESFKMEVERRFSAGDKHFVELESALESLPSRDDVNALKVGLAEISGQMAAVAATLKQIERPVHMIIEHALQEKR